MARAPYGTYDRPSTAPLSDATMMHHLTEMHRRAEQVANSAPSHESRQAAAHSARVLAWAIRRIEAQTTTQPDAEVLHVDKRYVPGPSGPWPGGDAA